MTFSQFKALVNGVNEQVWGEAIVYVGDDALCPVVDLSQSSGLPAIPPDSAFSSRRRIRPTGGTDEQIHPSRKRLSQAKPKT